MDNLSFFPKKNTIVKVKNKGLSLGLMNDFYKPVILRPEKIKFKKEVENLYTSPSIFLQSCQYNILAIHELVLKNSSACDIEIEKLFLCLAQEGDEEVSFNMKRKIKQLNHEADLLIYEELTTPLLDEYKKKYKNIENDFNLNLETKNLRDILIEKYLKIAKTFCKIPNRENYQSILYCVCCDSKNINLTDMICLDCNTFINELNYSVENFAFSKQCTSRFTNQNSVEYSKETNLLQCIDKIQANQLKHIDISIIDEIKNELNFQKILKPSKTDIFKILKSKKIPKLAYENAYLIYYLLTGEKITFPADLLKLVKNDCHIIEKVLNELNENEKPMKKYCFNVYYKLLRLLVKNGYQPKSDDWFLVSNKIGFYDKIYRKICDEVGWNFEPIKFY